MNDIENKDIDSPSKEDLKKIKWKKHLPIYIVEAVILVAAVVGLYFVTRATKMQKVNIDESNIAINEEVKSMQEVATTPAAVIEDEVVDEEETIDKEAISAELYKKYNGLFNIAFFGVDSREGELGKGTRSDSIMVCSIDMETHEVKLISIFRDTYLNLGNDSYNKCNSAYALGGPEQALSMINMNTDLFITDYVTVGFGGMMDAVNALGGVDIEVTDDEVVYLNDYAMVMSVEMDLPYTPIEGPGLQTLNGLQATAYCRIRYTKGDDFKRAQRQRDVLTAMLEKAKTVSFSSLADAVTAIMPSLSTSLSVDDLLNMVSIASDYEVTVSDGFPFEGMRNGGTIGSKGSCVVPVSLQKNVKKLHELLYNDIDYEPSSDVKKYSSIIESDTKDFLQY